jgi:D-serine deaminase-like pyridoxal phosphate-dependent protein
MNADVYLIVDSGLGRCGVSPEKTGDMGARIAGVPGVRLRGVLTHEGTVYGASDREDLATRSKAVASLMVGAADSIRAHGIDLPTVSMGASASARIAREVPGVTEVRPGIFAFNDLGQIALGNATPATCAVRVVATVVSHPEPTRACIDAGSKTLSQDGLPAHAMTGFTGHGLLCDLPGWRVDRLSEEHGWLRWAGDGAPTPLSIGQRVQVIPNHVCTVFSSLGESVAIRDGEVEAVWRTISPGASR